MNDIGRARQELIKQLRMSRVSADVCVSDSTTAESIAIAIDNLIRAHIERAMTPEGD